MLIAAARAPTRVRCGIKIRWTSGRARFSLTPADADNRVYAAVAYIDNPNEGKYVPSVQYEVVLYDSRGSVVNRVSEHTPIMPGSVTPVFVPQIATGKSTAASASFRFVEDPVFADYPRPYSFDVSDLTVESSLDLSPRVSAMVQNIGSSMVSEVEFVAIVYDEDNISIAASRTFEKYIEPGESRLIQFTWVYPFFLRRVRCPEGVCERKVKRVEVLPVVVRR